MNLEEFQEAMTLAFQKLSQEEPTLENARKHLEKALDILCEVKYQSRKIEFAHDSLTYIIKSIDMLERLCN